MIDLKNITKYFKGSSIPAVQDMTFSINKGEVVAILGENGAGKTTTLRIISTILKPTSGTCKVGNYDVSLEPHMVRAQIGMLLGGETGLYDRLTAYENVEYFARLQGIGKDEFKSEMAEISELFDMGAWLNRKTGTFSRGMKQKTAIARSVIHKPSVMILDEPTTGLDVTSSRVVHDFIKKSKMENRTILFSSHTISEVTKLADRLIIIHKGSLLETGTVDELSHKYNMSLEDLFIKLIGEDL